MSTDLQLTPAPTEPTGSSLVVLDVNTQHITRDDLAMLTTYSRFPTNYPCRIFGDEHGIMVHVPELECLEELLLSDYKAMDSLSEEYWNIIKAASREGYNYVLFDGDAYEHSTWPTHCHHVMDLGTFRKALEDKGVKVAGTAKEFYNEPSIEGIWISAECSEYFEYYYEDAQEKTYTLGVRNDLHEFAKANGWYFEWYDTGTMMAWEI